MSTFHFEMTQWKMKSPMLLILGWQDYIKLLARWLNGTIPASPGVVKCSSSPRKMQQDGNASSNEKRQSTISSPKSKKLPATLNESGVFQNGMDEQNRIPFARNQASSSSAASGNFQRTKQKLLDWGNAALTGFRQRMPSSSSHLSLKDKEKASLDAFLWDPLQRRVDEKDASTKDSLQRSNRRSGNLCHLYDRDQNLSSIASNYGGIIRVTIHRAIRLTVSRHSHGSEHLGAPMVLVQLDDQKIFSSIYSGEEYSNPFWNETFELYCVNILRQELLVQVVSTCSLSQHETVGHITFPLASFLDNSTLEGIFPLNPEGSGSIEISLSFISSVNDMKAETQEER
eukprot:jgi/Galph1/4900/GphlegSOOS_G3583.1